MLCLLDRDPDYGLDRHGAATAISNRIAIRSTVPVMLTPNSTVLPVLNSLVSNVAILSIGMVTYLSADFVLVDRGHNKLMLLLVFSNDSDLVTELYDAFMPDLFVQFVGRRFNCLQRRAAYEVNDCQEANDFPKPGAQCHNRIIHRYEC